MALKFWYSFKFLFQREDLIYYLETHPSLLIITINALTLIAIFIRQCVVRKNSKSINIYSVSQPQQQETSFITNTANETRNEERYYTFSLDTSAVDVDFHYYDEVPEYFKIEFSKEG